MMRALLPAIIAAAALSPFGLAARDAHGLPQATRVALLELPGTDAFVYPVMGPRISSDYGSRRHPIKRFSHHHNGIDLAAPKGSPIRVIAEGQVVYADPYAGYGKLIVVRHKNGLTSHYGHCSKIDVQPGQQVRAGDIIGTVGSTGISTGPHLHFEIRKSGKPLDPEKVLPGLADSAQG